MSMQSGFMGRMMNEKEKSYRLRDINKNVTRMFLKYMKPHLKILLVTFAVMSIVALVNMTVPYLSKIAIDRFIAAKSINGLHLVLAAFVIIYGIFWLTSYWGSYLSLKIGQGVVANIRRDLFRHVSSLSMDFFSRSKTGEVMSRLTNDVNTLADFISSGVVNLVSDVLTLSGVIVIMFLLNVKLALIVLITIPIIFAGTLLIGRYMRKAYGSVREKTGKLNAGVEENISGIRVVKAMSRETGNMESFEKLNKENLYAHIKAVVISAIFFPFMSLTGTLGTALVVLAGGMMIINGEAGATVGLLMAFMGYTNRFFLPLRDLSQIYGVYQGAAASAERIYEYFQIQPVIVSPKVSLHLPKTVKGNIELTDVSFQYEPDRPVIRNVNAIIPPKKTTAIVGPTGAGKSTIIKLLARLYDVDKGSVKIDGVDIKEIDISELRNNVMLVPQDVFLFTGTIKDNIRYGKPDAGEEEVIKASVNACADRFIQKLPDGYETQVGEGGMLLSGGQRQLIAFARAILADRPILILDEATSSVDAATEVLIQQALDNLVKDRTSIIIAHRFTTLRRAEKIIVLDEGEIVGYDSHEILLETCGLYKRLFEKQWVS
jgi:ATP-binding cassette, subfamily B, multidrug efflux pump